MKYGEGSIQDIDYLYSTARLRSLERGLLSHDRMDRMCDAKNLEDAVKVLAECGYDDTVPVNPGQVDELLAEARNELFKLVESIAPDLDIVDVFKVKYDYHNVKTFLKGEHGGENYQALFIPCGRVPVEVLCENLRENSYKDFSSSLRRAAEEAKEVLGRTNDPQLADFVLDNACYKEMLALAQQTNSKFLVGYVKLLIDSANLRAVVRSRRMGKDADFLRLCLIPDGTISPAALISEMNPDAFEALYNSSPLAAAGVTGAAVLRGEARLTSVDLKCDDALTEYLKKAKYVAFGEQPLIAFLVAKENEFTAVRTIMAGRFAGLSPDMIKERLRDSYV